MRPVRAFLRRMRGLFNRAQHDRDINAEFESHLQMQIDENLRMGMTPEAARRDALLRSGSLESAKDAVRDRRGLPVVETVLQDIRHSIRSARKNPGFTAIVVITLALGIGANTAIFSLIDAVLLRMLPVPHPEQLVFVRTSAVETGSIRVSQSISIAAVEQMDGHAKHLSGVAAFRYRLSFNVIANGSAAAAAGQLVSGRYSQVLGIAPALGRMIRPDDDRADGRVAVLSFGYWQRRFGGDSGIIGRNISVNNVPVTVIGVAPREFYGLSADAAPDVLLPMATAPQLDAGRPSSETLKPGDTAGVVFARLVSTTGSEDAAAELSPILRKAMLAELPGESNADQRAAVARLSAELMPASQGMSLVRNGFDKPLRVLMAVVALVMLIACANVANLLLARSSARQREIAIRLSLGSSRARLLRQLLIESLFLSLLGTLAGFALGVWARYGIVYMAAADSAAAIPWQWNGRMFMFTAAVSIVNAAVFGLIPALRASKFDVAIARRSGRQDHATGKRALGRALVVCQISVSLVLLIDALLLLSTFRNRARVDLGYTRENTWLLTIDARKAGYQGTRAAQLFRDASNRLGRVPGVQGVTISRQRLLTGQVYMNSVYVPDYVLAKGESVTDLWVILNRVGPNFFGISGTRIVSGRDFSERDTEHSPKVAVINESMARRFFGSRDPVGRRIAWSRVNEPDIEIVGVVRDAKYMGLEGGKQPVILTPFLQDPEAWTQATMVVRTTTSRSSIGSELRSAISSIDQAIPISGVTTLDAQVIRALVPHRLVAVLTGAFGLLALTLSAIGLYGVLSYGVAQRTSEIGVRIALGARKSGILRMILGEAAWLVGISAVVGLGLAAAAGRLIRNMLYGISPTDSLALASAVTVLLAVAALAGIVPAWKATRVDPMVALRHE